MATVVAFLRKHSALVVLVPATVLLVAGVGYWLLDDPTGQRYTWGVAGLIGAIASLVAVVRGLIRRSSGVDVLALMAIVGALWLGEYLAAALIAVMIGTGNLLDQWAQSAAERELAALVARSPRRALLVRDGGLVDVDIADVAIGCVVQVPSGTIVPVDGRLQEAATLDESALTGESDLVRRPAGDVVRSGVVNAGNAVSMIATATAENSTYADIVRLVQNAQATSAPYVRMADRLAWWFIPSALAVAGIAWLLSGEPGRAVAVLVVATPCPLLLAVPVAIISGVSQAAARGVVVKGGQMLERLATGDVLLFDKTGTLTIGQPRLIDVRAAPGADPDEVLVNAASVEQVSPHAYATAIVQAAKARGLPLTMPADVHESHGQGLSARVGDVEVRLGRDTWVHPGDRPDWVDATLRESEFEGWASVAVAIDGNVLGVLLLADPMRPDAPRMLRNLRSSGINRMVLVTGDREDLAKGIGRLAGVDDVRANQTPSQKVTAVDEEGGYGSVIMVGDGINDAPALAAADVGVALAGRGSSAASEAAGVVLTVDRIDRLADAMAIARRARRIALQSAWVGMGLSVLAMVAAAFGFLPAAAGALLQEGIDILAIGNALRVRLHRHRPAVALTAEATADLYRIRSDHEAVRSIAARIRAAADEMADARPEHRGGDPWQPLRELLPLLQGPLLAHERTEETELLPTLRPLFGGVDPLASLSRTHAEIEQQVERLTRLMDTADNSAVDRGTHEHLINDAVRTLYGLYSVLLLHNAQEDEELFSLLERNEAAPD